MPGLKEQGISINTVALLMRPSRRKTIVAAQYKALIAARVPEKKNCYREDQHYLFARMAYCRELAAKFPDKFAMFSCDDMSKIKVGPLAVSRYHQDSFLLKIHPIILTTTFQFLVIISFLLDTYDLFVLLMFHQQMSVFLSHP